MNGFDKRGSEAARAAWLYYHEEQTQGDIARELNVSRSTVTRLLQRAKNDGLVKIRLDVTAGTFQAEREIERAFGLDKVRIVPFSSNDAIQKRWLGHVAAELLVGAVTENAIVAVSWGTTMRAMTDTLTGVIPVPGVQVVALVGGLHNASAGSGTNEIAAQVGHVFDARVLPLLAPVYVQDEATAAGLAVDPGIHDALDLARRATVAAFGLGALHDDATMLRLGHVTPEQNRFLLGEGAVGEIACRWIDRNGQAVALPASIYPISITLDELRAVPQRLALAGGDLKRNVVLAALRGGFVTTLVIDERTADDLLRNR